MTMLPSNANWLIYALLTAILLAAAARNSLTDTHDPYKCNAALSRGQWIDPPLSNRSSPPYSRWQPDGCTTKAYNAKKIGTCLDSNGDDERQNYFIGDSTIRELFWATARKLNSKKAQDQSTKAEKHQDIKFVDGKTTLEFVWDPWLNSSQLAQNLARTKAGAKDTSPSATKDDGLLVIGAGLWFAKETSDSVMHFKDTLDVTVGKLPSPDLTSKGHHRAILVPVQPLFYENLDSDHKTMTPEKVKLMNDYLEELASIHDIDYVSSFVAMVKDMPASAYEPTGRHLLPYISDRQAELILNIRCNDKQREYPYDGTCCFEYHLDVAEILMLAGGAILLILVAWVELRKWTGVGSSGIFADIENRLPLLWPILVMWLALSYCYLTDRTHLFNKVHKFYNAQDFWIFCLAILISGFATIRRSSSPQKANQEKAPNPDQPFLSRDQTDEWKGWMQLLILAYHYTHGSKILPIYRFIRLLVASYLFMSGYGHAAYFYQKKDFSLKRVVAVLVRLNLLSCLLPWMMGTDYLFYYFAPLVTYWYAVIWIVMWFQHEKNEQLWFFISKIGISAAITTFLHTQQWLLEPVVMLINAVFGSKWDAREWLFRVSLDQYIVYIGMIVAVLYIRYSKPPAPPAPPQGSMSTTSHTRAGFAPQLQNSFFFGASASALIVYWYFGTAPTTKTTSNAIHTYISPLPILAFVHLRNSTRGLRNNYSTAFAWIGKISLETFVLQYHIWLANDTQGLLDIGVLGHGGMDIVGGFFGTGMGLSRWVNCVILGVVFVWISYKVANATGAITSLVVKALFR